MQVNQLLMQTSYAGYCCNCAGQPFSGEEESNLPPEYAMSFIRVKLQLQ